MLLGKCRERNPMIRMSLPYLLEFAEQLEPLGRLPDGGVPYSEVSYPLFMAQWALEGFTSGSIFRPYLRSSWQLSQQLLTNIRTQTTNSDQGRQLLPYELYGVKSTYQQYKRH